MFEYHEIVSMLNLQHFNVGHRKTWRGVDLEKATSYFGRPTDEVLRAMYDVASREKLRHSETRCNSCGMPITFRKPKTPFDRSGKNHFIACPNREAHRQRK